MRLAKTFVRTDAADQRAKPAARLRTTWLDAVVLLIILGCGLAQLRTDFGGDQFLYLVGAQKLAHHGVMYRDFWDLKQPGIYYLYCLGGLLFGFTPAGIHLFEALYQTAFAAVLIAVCSVRLPNRWVASVVPLLTIGVYYGTATNYVLGSVEAFAGFPLFIAAVCAADAFSAKRASVVLGFAGGCAGALAVMLKLAFLPLVAALWLTAIVLYWRSRPPVHSAQVLLALIAGLVVPLALFGAYLATAGVLGLALHTALVDPALILRHLRPGSKTPLKFYARTFVAALWPLMVLAIAGVIGQRKRLDVLAVQMAVWALASIPIIVAQAWSFYLKFFIAVVPIGVLAAFGLSYVGAFAAARGQRGRIAATVAAIVAIGCFGVTVLHTQRDNAAWGAANRRELVSTIAFLNAPHAAPGPIYVMGDPKVYYYTHRDQAVAINGWSPELLLPDQWRVLEAELGAAQPAYIMVANGGDVPIAGVLRDTPEMSDFLAAHYRAGFRSDEATVYARR